jgi:hypothetical protein
MIGGIAMMAMSIVDISLFVVASQPVTRMVEKDINDAGRPTRVDSKLLKPKPVSIRFVNAWVPPFGV